MGVLGWLIEYFYSGQNLSLDADSFNKKILHINVPFLHIWAIGGLMFYIMNRSFKDILRLPLAFITGLLVTAMECGGGHVSNCVNGYKTWDYKNHHIPFCHGYCSIDVSLCWTLLAYISFYLIDKFIP